MTMDVRTARERIQQKYAEVMKGTLPGALELAYPRSVIAWDVVYAAERLVDDIKNEHYEDRQALLKELVELKADAAMSKVYEAQLAMADKAIARMQLEIDGLKNGFITYPNPFTPFTWPVTPDPPPHYVVTCSSEQKGFSQE